MTRIYHPWDKWECYKSGFYSRRFVDGGQLLYAEFLADIPRFSRAIQKVFLEWTYSCEHFLTNQDINRVAWIGQSAMCIDTTVPSKYRGGFFLLTKVQQLEANQCAMQYLAEWEQTYESSGRVSNEMAGDGLSLWDT